MDGLLDEMLARAMTAEKEAEDQLFRHLFVRFRAIAKRTVGEADAEDIAQEACLTILQKYKTATYPKGFAAWAYKILRNKIGNYLLKRKDLGPQREADRVTDSSVVQPDCELKTRLVKCFRELIKRNRNYGRVLNLVHQGYKTKEICRRLGIRPNNFYVILFRGRRLLKNCLERGVM